MTDPRTVKIVDSYRNPKDNEFFFREDPFNNSALRQLFDYLEENYGIEIEEIPGWQLKSTTHTAYTYNQYENIGFGCRVIKHEK